ncbi:MAG: hypothetical protein WAN21_21780 [Candidatus Sulfotelmatobacter sp.]
MAASATNPRTPFGTTEPLLPTNIDGLAMQDVVNDPIKLLQAVITKQKADGHTFEGTVLNIATQANITFFKNPNSKAGDPTVVVMPTNGAGGIENILFSRRRKPGGSQGSERGHGSGVCDFLDRESKAPSSSDVHAAAACTDGHPGLRDTEAASGDGGEFGLAAHLGGNAAQDV